MVPNQPKCSEIAGQRNPNKTLGIAKRLQLLLNFMLDPAVVVDLEGNLIVVNDRFAETTGFAQDELVKQSLPNATFVSSKSRICLMRKCHETAARTDILAFEIEINRKNGTKMFAEVKTRKIESSGRAVELLVFHDVTDRTIREALFEESEERYLSVCEDARLLVLDLDLKGNICYINKTAEDYGFDLKNVIGKDFLEFVSKENRSKLISAHLSVVSGKKVEEEIQVTTSKGLFKLDYFGSPIRKAGSIIGCRITMIDVTCKQMERKLEKYADSALSLNEAYLDRFGH
jgi:PAS domain S-box-containing protein